MDIAKLNDIARQLVRPGKGILAADESTGTIGKRLKTVSVENTEENRRSYREILFRTREALHDCISGVILYDETLRQRGQDGTPFVEIIEQSGAIPGVKVDKGTVLLAGTRKESITEGLDGLRDRLEEYFALGAKFAKWRGVFSISDRDHTPSYNCVRANAHALARYAALAQEVGMVPIVEPEVLMDGENDIEACAAVSEIVLQSVFEELDRARVALEGLLLKPNMVIAGKQCSRQNEIAEIAEHSVRTLKRHVPAAVPGIVFLSGGQKDIEATAHLCAINQFKDLPWTTTFSFGRALQSAALSAWLGDSQNVPTAQKIFAHRARMNSLASQGRWTPEHEATE